MKNQTFQYKGYTATATYSSENQCFIGKVIGIDHQILLQGTTLEDIHQDFVEAIDDYPTDCAEFDIVPIPPPQEIMVPFSPELYAKASFQAEHRGIPIKTFMENAVQQAIS
jgi:predicted HicB family RNase H-like nuclease